MPENLPALLRANPYPGRGIVLGAQFLPGAAVVAYWIMGRSANSRNRVFAETDDGIRTEPYDPACVEDPSLILYHPVRLVGRRTVVTNGDQTDTIRRFLLQGKSFEDALRTRTFEPDAPNCTPRISGLMEPDGSYRLSILKASPGGRCLRQFFEYPAEPGLGHLLTTYRGDGAPLPSFTGEPIPVAIDAPDAETFAGQLWDALNGDNRVSLFVRHLDLRSGLAHTCVINRHGSSWSRAARVPIWK